VACSRKCLRTRDGEEATARGRIGAADRAIEAKPSDQGREKFGFEGAYSDELAVRAAIGSIEGQAAIEKVLAAWAFPETAAPKAEDHGKLGDGSVENGGIDNLAKPGFLAFQQCGQYSDHEKRPAAAHVADKIQGRDGRARGRANRMKRARQRKKCQVMPSGLSHGSILSPPRHARIDEPGIARQNDIGTEAKALHNARPEAFDEDICFFDRAQTETDGLGFLEVEHKQAALPTIDGRVGNCKKILGAGALDAQHIRAKVGQQHPAIGRWT
jgi:hypothetical protein